jgi:hypothetical protein
MSCSPDSRRSIASASSRARRQLGSGSRNRAGRLATGRLHRLAEGVRAVERLAPQLERGEHRRRVRQRDGACAIEVGTCTHQQLPRGIVDLRRDLLAPTQEQLAFTGKLFAAAALLGKRPVADSRLLEQPLGMRDRARLALFEPLRAGAQPRDGARRTVRLGAGHRRLVEGGIDVGAVLLQGAIDLGAVLVGDERGGSCRRTARAHGCQRRDGGLALPLGFVTSQHALLASSLRLLVVLSGLSRAARRRPRLLLGMRELARAACLWTVAERAIAGSQRRLLGAQRVKARRGGGHLRFRARVRRIGLGQLAADAVERRLRATRRRGPATTGDLSVAPVRREIRGRGVACLDHPRERVAVVLEAAECLRDIRDKCLVEWRECLRERVGERSLVRALGQLRRADLDQQVDERAVAQLSEPEERLVDRAAVRTRGPMHRSIGAERLLQTVARERDAGTVDERQLFADALACEEEPVRGDPAAGDRLEPAAERAERDRPFVVTASQLQPRVAEPLGVGVLAAEQQVPLHPLLRVGVRLDAVRGEVSVEQERQREGEHLRLAGAVVAAQQQSAVAKPELLPVVVEDVDEPRAQRLPARRGGLRQRPAHPAVSRVAPGSVGAASA